MAIIISGKSSCSLCGKIIYDTDTIYGFTAFINNEADPCYIFSDSAFHKACVREHESGHIAIHLVDDYKLNTGIGKRICIVCKTEIMKPDDYLLIGFLTDHKDNPLKPFNYTHLHKSCISKWHDRSVFIEQAQVVLKSGNWRGSYLSNLLSYMKR